MQIKELQSLLLRDVMLIDSESKLQPVLSYFKKMKGEGSLAVVTKVFEDQANFDKDPEYKKIGILTKENVIDELL